MFTKLFKKISKNFVYFKNGPESSSSEESTKNTLPKTPEVSSRTNNLTKEEQVNVASSLTEVTVEKVDSDKGPELADLDQFGKDLLGDMDAIIAQAEGKEAKGQTQYANTETIKVTQPEKLITVSEESKQLFRGGSFPERMKLFQKLIQKVQDNPNSADLNAYENLIRFAAPTKERLAMLGSPEQLKPIISAIEERDRFTSTVKAELYENGYYPEGISAQVELQRTAQAMNNESFENIMNGNNLEAKLEKADIKIVKHGGKEQLKFEVGGVKRSFILTPEIKDQLAAANSVIDIRDIAYKRLYTILTKYESRSMKAREKRDEAYKKSNEILAAGAQYETELLARMKNPEDSHQVADSKHPPVEVDYDM